MKEFELEDVFKENLELKGEKENLEALGIRFKVLDINTIKSSLTVRAVPSKLLQSSLEKREIIKMTKELYLKVVPKGWVVHVRAYHKG